MMLKIQLCIIRIYYILKSIQIETVHLNGNNVSQYYSYCIFDQIYAAFFQKH